MRVPPDHTRGIPLANGTLFGVDEAKLWSMADALRNNMDAAEYKHVVLGLIFLKYISDAFEARYEYLQFAVDDSKDEYHSLNFGGSPNCAGVNILLFPERMPLRQRLSPRSHHFFYSLVRRFL